MSQFLCGCGWPLTVYPSPAGGMRFHCARCQTMTTSSHAELAPALPAAPSAEPPRVSGKVIAFRGWTLDGYKLRSANQHLGYWDIGPNKAVCKAYVGFALANHDAPDPHCGCGLYAYHTISHEDYARDQLIWGAVTAWGRIEVHANGIRAEYAEPVVLAYHPQQPYGDVKRAEAIASEISLPFVHLDDLEAEALKHGRPVPEEHRPERPEPEYDMEMIYAHGGYISGAYMPPPFAPAYVGGGATPPSLPKPLTARRLVVLFDLAAGSANLTMFCLLGTWWNLAAAVVVLTLASMLWWQGRDRA